MIDLKLNLIPPLGTYFTLIDVSRPCSLQIHSYGLESV